MRILLADDELESRRSMAEFLGELGHEVTECGSGAEALALFGAAPYPLVLTDIRMPGMDGLRLLKALSDMESGRRAHVVIITGHGDVDSAITALRHGAYDYLRKPVNVNELATVVGRSAEHQSLREENRRLTERFDASVAEATEELREDLARVRATARAACGVAGVVAASRATKRVLADARLYHGDPSIPVLIEGETGTGKEVVARLIHHGDGGVTTPLVALNCASIPATLFESELFGYEAGAFSGGRAKGARGKLELAEHGTVLLDEIGDMPLELQPKLLRVLQERTFYRVGGLKKRHLRARIVCASNQNLQKLVSQGRFRADLFHRLKVGHVRVPPLRERREDIGPLAELFLAREAERTKKRFRSLHASTRKLLERQAWPGNVRELENAIVRAVLEHDQEMLLPGHLAFLAADARTAAGSAPAGTEAARLDPESLELPDDGLDIEALNDRLVAGALDKCGGNKTKTAQYLGISRRSLYCRLARLAGGRAIATEEPVGQRIRKRS